MGGVITNNNQPKLSLDGIIKANVRLYTEDPIFKHSAESELPNSGFRVKELPRLSITDGTENGDVYLIDIHTLNYTEDRYQHLANLITTIKSKDPESRFLVVPSQQQYRSREFNPLRVVDSRYQNDVSIRPLFGTFFADNPMPYEDEILQFINIDVMSQLKKIVMKPNEIKIGGSLFDLELSSPEPVLKPLLSEIGNAYKTHPIILTVGGGPANDVNKAFQRKSRDVYNGAAQEYFSRTSLEAQAMRVCYELEKLGINTLYYSPGDLKRLDISGNKLRSYIPVVSLSDGDIPASESDTHTLYIADHFGLNSVIFAKNTDGIYLWDPNSNRQAISDELFIRGIDIPEPLQETDNKFFSYIYASDILKGKITRYGFDTDGKLSDNHVIEEGALQYFLNRAKNLQVIHVLNGGKAGTITSALEGNLVGSYIFKG